MVNGALGILEYLERLWADHENASRPYPKYGLVDGEQRVIPTDRIANLGSFIAFAKELEHAANLFASVASIEGWSEEAISDALSKWCLSYSPVKQAVSTPYARYKISTPEDFPPVGARWADLASKEIAERDIVDLVLKDKAAE